MKERRLHHLLRRFGCSEKEAAVYAAVLELGEAKPSELASAADVSTRYAYEVGERLESRGFVRVDDHRTPTTVVALPPEAVVSELNADLVSLEPLLHERYEEPATQHREVQVIKTSITLKTRIRDLIDGADAEVAFALPATVVGEFEEELVAARDRGVLVLLLVTGPYDPPPVSDLADVVRVDLYGSPCMLSVDEHASVVMSPDMLERSNSEDIAVATFDDRVCRLLSGGFLGHAWQRAEEHHVTARADLPASYRHFRHAVLQAAIHDRQGTPMTVEVEGQWVGEGTPAVIAGRLAGIVQSVIEPPVGETPTALALEVDDGDRTLTVGAPKSAREDVACSGVTLEEA